MTPLEQLARTLAADLSSKGEADWRRFALLAKIVGQDRQRTRAAPSWGDGASAKRIVAAARDSGERDRDRLKRLALQVFEISQR